MATVYHINKGVNRAIEFRGLRGQYIGWLAVGLVLLLITFALLYISGLSLFIILPVIFGSGTGLFITVFRLNSRFGQHGLGKYLAKRNLPDYIRISSRKVFTSLKKG